MKSQLFVFICITCCIFSGYTQDITKTQTQDPDIVSFILTNSTEFKKVSIDSQLSMLQYKSDKMIWLPAPFLTIEPKLGYYRSDNSFIDFPVTVGISQKLPLLSSLSVSVSQPFSLNISELRSSYGFSSQIALHSNGAFFIPEIADAYRNAEKTFMNNLLRQINLQYSSSMQSLKKDILMQISYWLYYKAIAAIYERKNTLLEEKSKEDFDLFQLGRITSLEFAEREKQRMQNFSAYMQALEQTFQYETNLFSAGIPIEHIDFSFPQWIEYVTLLTAEYNIHDQSQKELELIQRKLVWKNTIENHIKTLPVISCTYTLNPSSPVNHSPIAFWENASMPNWSLSFSTRIPIVPWDISYSAEQRFQLEYEKYTVHSLQLHQEIENEIILRNKKQQMLSILEEKNKQQYILELERQTLYEELYGTGRITKMDAALQHFITEESFIQWYFSKLNKIEHILTFY